MRSWRGWSWDDGNFGGSGLDPNLRATGEISISPPSADTTGLMSAGVSLEVFKYPALANEVLVQIREEPSRKSPRLR